MPIIKQNARVAHHRLTDVGEIPTEPTSGDFTDGSWIRTDILTGELSFNLTDDRAWFRSNNGIIELQTLHIQETVTADATPYDFNMLNVALAAGETVQVNATVIGTDGDTNVCGAKVFATFYKPLVGAVSVLVGTTVDIKANSTQDVNLVTDGTDVFCRVTGLGGTNISWVVNYDSYVTSV